MVASTPRELSAITASSLSSNTWRPMSQAYSDDRAPLDACVAPIALMTQYAAFLRGVNVGGVNLKMGDVAGALTDAGLAEVRTILATGNVTLDSPKAADAVRATAETALRKHFGYEAGVLVYPTQKGRYSIDGSPLAHPS